MERIILFDGVCNLCNSSVQFIINRDPNAYFKFASLQSEMGQKLLKECGYQTEMKSFVLIEDHKVYIKSTAALRVCLKLSGAWSIFSVFRVIPPVIRDKIYDLFAKNRYQWFGKKDSCMLPTPEMKQRFLE
ncbi:thiol-disulfide oxidoreductase DCC family protein [Bacillus sp. MRMR6]|uniref:thiol-disulfide oxidoreductase DCC family protein n=1 Tax=Bacillus sp. MRMR6 TaxID=1928617 RepID=UPI000950E3C4|nr:thiol-disulfide oxidoreductase DCC family protein [Bacillus sp. MRMR6]OLS38531.1 thiol-disulfide oxidoreductase [Bacillus sp. MRMR6]